MPINIDVVGKKTEPIPFAYDVDRVILYALGIGAGVDELDFVYEKYLKVFPTFAVVPFVPALFNFISKINLNLHAVLHGEQKIVLHKMIPPSATIYTSTLCETIYDKGDKGAVVTVHSETCDENGEPVFENTAVVIDRSAGNFGGDSGPKSDQIAPPEGKEPDFHIEYATSLNQSALYRLSGDKNPLHIEPKFALKAGFNQPILHGLCSFGFAGRAILHSICGSDPSRLKSFSARFINVVFPGDKLIVEGWKARDGIYVIQMKKQDGQLVLGNAVAEIV